MPSPQVYIARGRSSSTRRYSQARQPNSAIFKTVLETFSNDTLEERREQILRDSAYVAQFACPWNDKVGFLTRPEFTTKDGNTVILGSYSDQIGNVYPVLLSTNQFQGFFTTLVRKDDALEFGLVQHPSPPDTIPGPPPAGNPPGAAAPSGTSTRRSNRTTTADDGSASPAPAAPAAPPGPVQASLDRLNFDSPSEEDQHSPVLVALPVLLPLPPGTTFPENTPFSSPRDTFRTSSRLFEVWLQGYNYVLTHNDGFSVTKGGPLFHLPHFSSADPFSGFTILDKVDAIAPIPVAPFETLGAQCTKTLTLFADDTWWTLGATTTPPSPTPAGGPAPAPRAADDDEHLPSPAQPTSAKEQAQARTAATVAAGYRLAFARLPDPEVDTDLQHVVLPKIHPDFLQVLQSPKPQDACVEFRQFLTGLIALANSSDLALSRDVTLEPSIATLAFVNCARSYHWLDLPLASATKTLVDTMLGFLHLLTPDRQALLAQVSKESSMGPVVLSHVADDKAQFEASKKSTLYIRGRHSSGRDMYHAICNFILLAQAFVDASGSSMLVKKLKRYADLLTSAPGRRFFDTYRDFPYLSLHIYQDIQHILTIYFQVGQSHTLRSLIKDGKSVPLANYTAVNRAADLLIDHLSNVIMGSGLGRFESQPIVWPWFQSSSPPLGGQRPAPITPEAPPSKRARQSLTTHTPETLATAKASGLLVFDKMAGGDTLPLCTVRDRHPRTKKVERLCMEFMTQGYSCPHIPCNKGHISHPKRLTSDQKRKELADFVSKTPGLAWGPGFAPPGTSTP